MTDLSTTNDLIHFDTNDIINNNSNVTIQTHDKRFHADDVGAISLLTSYYNRKGLQVHLIRSRDPSLLETSDVLVDVGGIYDHSLNRYDHHQDNCNETFSSQSKIPMSSIGMIWKHFGQEILHMYIEAQHDFNKIVGWENHIYDLWVEIYFKLIQEIDAHDNGVSMIDGGKRNYWSNLNLPSIIKSINVSITSFNNSNETDRNENETNGTKPNEKEPNEKETNETEQMKAFEKAVSLFGEVFEIKLKDVIRKYFDYHLSYDKVKHLLDETPSDCEYLIVNERINSIFKCLNSIDNNYRIKFIIFKNVDEITIRTRFRSDIYTPIVPLSGKMDKNDITFIHKGLFIAKTKNIETAIQLVELSLNENNKHKYTNNKTRWISNRFIIGGITSFFIVGSAWLGFNYFNSDY